MQDSKSLMHHTVLGRFNETLVTQRGTLQITLLKTELTVNEDITNDRT